MSQVAFQQLSWGRCRIKPGRVVRQNGHGGASCCSCVRVVMSLFVEWASILSECNSFMLGRSVTCWHICVRVRYRGGIGLFARAEKRIRQILGTCTSALRNLQFPMLKPSKKILYGSILPRMEYVLTTTAPLILAREETGSMMVCGRHTC